MGRYAEGTTVSVARSRDEIERIIKRYEVDAFGFMQRGDDVLVQFQRNGRVFRIEIPACDQPKETRRRWRCVVLWLKGALEYVDAGLASFESMFAYWTMLADGSTVGDKIEEQLDQIGGANGFPQLMPPKSA